MGGFRHRECISSYSEKIFTQRYERWCRKHKYNFSEKKAHEIYTAASGCVSVMPRNDTTMLLVHQAVS